MLTGKLNRNVLPLILLLAITLTAQAVARAIPDNNATEAGTVITNQAEGVYLDDAGTSYSTVSPTVTLTVLSVSTLKTTPDETNPSATVGPNEQATRVFQVCNTGNTPDLYTITRAEVSDPAALTSLFFDTDASGTITTGDQPIQVGVSMSPRVAPGSCIGVLASIDTKDYPANSNLTIRLTARSNVVNSATGRAEDDGTIINAVGSGAKLTDPNNPGLPPVKLVNGNAQSIVSQGVPFTYTIAFRNSGDAPARGVVVSDDLPSPLSYVGGTLQLDNRNLSDATDADEGYVQGNRVVVQLAELAAGQVVRINFKAVLHGSVPSGEGLTNVANLSAQNAPTAKSSTAVVVIDPFGTVFAGRGGSASPIPGARVEILQDQNGSLLKIPEGLGFDPNTSNANPYLTDGMGHFSFALAQEQLGSEATPARYFMRVAADGYTSRMLEVTAHPTQSGLFALLVHALDGQALARAGSFELVHEDVNINDMAAVALNIPMFEQHGLEISKLADQQRVEIGDAVSYRIEIHNPTSGAVNDVILHDTLPASFNYVAGTARLTVNSSTEQAIEPEISGGDLVFRVGAIPPGASAQLVYRVRVGANAREGNQENVAVAAGTFQSGERTQTSPARATVSVGAGVFSNRQIIVGRVFVDMNGNNKFDDGDRPVQNVRLYLSSGQSVMTDSQGLYSFPAINEGPQVLSLDPVTLPERYSLADDGTLASRSWTRMLRTPLGGGAMFRQNFVLTPNGAIARSSAATALAGEQSSAANQQVERSAAKPSAQTATHDSDNTHPTASGTYEFASTERVAPVEPGEVMIVSPEVNTVVMTPAMQLDARVALHWTVKLEVNGKAIPSTSIGTTRQDAANQITTYTFVGVNLKPGPNIVKVTPVDPNGVEGHAREITVMGRGPARRIEIVPERREVQAGGHDTLTFRVRAFDQWNNPAADDQIAIDTSAGNLLRVNADGTVESSAVNNQLAASVNSSASAQPSPSPGQSQMNRQVSQVVVQTRGGEAVLKLVGPGSPGEAKLHALSGRLEAQTEVRITPEMRSPILVGLAEVSVGQSLPQASMNNDNRHTQSRLSFYFSGRVWHDMAVTLAYDSNRPINRTAGRNRLFQQDPLERAYPLFGDSSTRFDAAPSNSKLYARIDYRRSYAMFGDFEADMNDLALVGYSRKLTGVKVHAENSQGDFVTVTGARPDTAFARDVFPAGGLSLLRLSHGEILEGSESVALEVRDRRNPETILSREILTRSVDYNLDPFTGEIFFLRYISAFDYDLNLAQIVVTYEHSADSLSSAVYTTRVRKRFASIGLQLGFAGVMQQQEDAGSFYVGGFDAEQNLPHRGKLRLAYARSQGEMAGGGGNFFDNSLTEHDGSAYMIELQQPLSVYEATIHARYSYATEGFFNPFGTTVTPGSRRGEISVEMRPRNRSTLRFGLMDERNRTASVNNSRLTFSASWEEVVNERLRLRLGYDHRHLNDELSDRTTDSNLLTASAEMRVTDNLQVSVRREQNVGEADPTYPNQTTLSATYQASKWAKLFVTQRLASAAIMPIGDFSQGGFASTGSRHETAIGIETRLGKYSSLVSRYQLENGIGGTDSFAIIGLQNRLPLSKQLQLELGFEHSFHLAGDGDGYDSVTFGFGWQPNEDFRASARYEFRDRGGVGQLVSIGAAGRLREGITALSRFQWARTNFSGRAGSMMDGTAALAIRPVDSDRMGLLFNYTHRSLFQDGVSGQDSTRQRIDSLSTDGYYQATDDLELYARLALRYSADAQNSLPFVSTLTYLAQARMQYRLTRRLDWAGEMRFLMQPSSATSRSSYGTELGLWLIPDLRVGLGYNFNQASEPRGVSSLMTRRGFYFTLSSKISRLFDLFGTQGGLSGQATGSQENADNSNTHNGQSEPNHH